MRGRWSIQDRGRMDFQELVRSKPTIQLGRFVARHLPRWAGHRIARIVGNLIARYKPGSYWTVHANLRHILGPGASERTLDEMTRRLFCNATRAYYDFFHVLGKPPGALAEMVPVPDTLISGSKAATARGQGVLMLGTHMASFDLVILSLSTYDLPIQILSLADPPEGFRFMNRLRATPGIEVTPISAGSVRAAVQRLQGGGIVATGVDWPVPDEGAQIAFFGQPAYLPVGPARLALMAGAVVFIGSLHYDAAQGYVLEVSGPIEVTHSGSRRQDILDNAQRLAALVEEYVRAHPDQWMMFHPAWPEPPAA
jgi:lauroyl/myristoyl acyltransferase